MSDDYRDWIGAQQAAELLGISQKTVYTWIKNGFGPPAYSLYGQWRYRREEVEDWIASRRQKNEDPLFQVVSGNEAAQLIGVSKTVFWRLIEAGRGPPSFMFHRRYVFKKLDVEAFAQEYRKNACVDETRAE